MSNHQPQSAGAGPPSAGMGMQHGQGGQGPPQPSQNMSQQNLNQIVRTLDLSCHVPLSAFWELDGYPDTSSLNSPFRMKV